ncbi:MAG: hypothetical protein HQK79_03165 [Desulfobacterales bacterium]|nr:hypothetical protein [Desulfobacterales bacterium]
MKRLSLAFYIICIFASVGYAKELSISGYLEWENFINNSTIIKTEGHPKVTLKYGDDSLYIKSVAHGYLYPENQTSFKEYYNDRVEVQELFISSLFKDLELQVGKKIIKWGTADTINPTSYFNPFDLTEILLKEDDELYIGVPAISGTYIYGDYSFQAVITPVHTPSKLPKQGSPWEFKFEKQLIPVEFNDKGKELDSSFKNSGIGIRFSRSLKGADFSLSAYTGPDRDIILIPSLNINKIEITPIYEKIASFGADIAFPIGDVTLQFEGTYTPNKKVVANYLIEKTGYFFAAFGGTWLFNDKTTIIFEYLKGIYTSDRSKYLNPFFSDLLSGSFERKFLDDYLIIEIKGLINTRDRSLLMLPKLTWDFQNGLKAEAVFGIFDGDPDTLFGGYDDKDILNLRIRYHF